ncbi:hypothetical protein NDU88_003690 [Pleurodeles waltl]|uniref:Uncharacterized protein n=1 Tax=Pleurodeles waltl TaxID=8319 RepID=A0AAV7M7T7_PLEWA|nr:hypothetical protein NDU88_003690 [Pleurodeles waltl]
MNKMFCKDDENLNHCKIIRFDIIQAPCDGSLRTATNPPDVLALSDPAAPDPEGEGVPSNPLQHLGAEGQSPQLCALSWVNPESETGRRSGVEGSLTGSPGDAAKRMARENTTKRITRSRGDTINNGGAGVPHGNPNTSGAGGAQQEFRSRFGKSVAFPGVRKR